MNCRWKRVPVEKESLHHDTHDFLAVAEPVSKAPAFQICWSWILPDRAGLLVAGRLLARSHWTAGGRKAQAGCKDQDGHNHGSPVQMTHRREDGQAPNPYAAPVGSPSPGCWAGSAGLGALVPRAAGAFQACECLVRPADLGAAAHPATCQELLECSNLALKPCSAARSGARHALCYREAHPRF